MNKEIKKDVIKLLIVSIPLLGFITYGFLRVNYEKSLLRKEPVYTTGVIVRKYTIGTKDFIKYRYTSNGKFYCGHNQYYSIREYIEIGDTCEVIYAKSDPEIKRLLRNKDKTIKMKHKYIVPSSF